jgi:hypothetical protein
MPADEVLQVPSYSKKDAVKKPTWSGDDWGFVARWHYPNVTLVMRRYGDPFCYRVAEIIEHGD